MRFLLAAAGAVFFLFGGAALNVGSRTTFPSKGKEAIALVATSALLMLGVLCLLIAIIKP